MLYLQTLRMVETVTETIDIVQVFYHGQANVAHALWLLTENNYV